MMRASKSWKKRLAASLLPLSVLLAAPMGILPQDGQSHVLAAAVQKQEKDFDYLILVNKDHWLPSDYEERVDLVTARNSMGREFQIERETYRHFQELQEAMKAQGIQIEMDSVYRSVARQQEIVDEFTEKYGADYVKKYVAVPGCSEHHTGLAGDVCLVVDGKVIDDNDELMAQKEIFQRIHRELANHGFILRLLEGKEDITGYNYEPWHFRYVGKDVAKKIMDSGITLEEYCAAH